jgi:hypothetical protein
LVESFENGSKMLNILFPSLYIFNTSPEDEHFYNLYFQRLSRLSSCLKYNRLDYDVWDMNMNGYFPAFRRAMNRIIQNKFFDNGILLVVLMNTVTMMLNGSISEDIMNNQVN